MGQLAVDYHGSGVFELRRSEAVAPAADEVQIAVAYTGICGTDLKIARGAMDGRITSARPIGHEMSGTIALVGSAVVGWKVGERVTVMPLDWCGDCAACRAGHSHVCHNLNFVGIDSPGSLQERWNVKADWVVRLPDDLDLRVAALVEPVAVAVHDLERARVRAGEHVVVVGGGPIGLIIALLARERGAHVLVSEVERSRLKLAQAFGAKAVDATTQDLRRAVSDWTDGAGADIAFEVSGSDSGVQALTDVLRVRGRGVVVAIHPESPRVDLFAVFWKELELHGARVYDRSDFEEAVRLLAAGTVPADALITDVFPLADVDSAFERLRQGRDVVKVLVSSLIETAEGRKAHDGGPRHVPTR
jgi:(R,R)-butanediol dehydrogenase/meso-butanediol dehydrogenase/diacetyl reductase